MRRLSPWTYLAWLALCAVLFVTLAGAEDPSRPKGRILSIDAGTRALALLHTRDARYRDYEVVHVAFAHKGEGGTRDRWVVLLDRVPHTDLAEAVVVELGSEDGRVLAIRKPGA
jgi:alkylhydroperoxidase family enzyme